MSPETDRIPVPTNGKGPHRVPGPSAGPAAPPASQIPEPAETTIVLTPAQLAVGFGILASLIVLLVGRLRRRGRSGSRGLFGRR